MLAVEAILGQAIRSHWAIENALGARRDHRAARDFAILRSRDGTVDLAEFQNRIW